MKTLLFLISVILVLISFSLNIGVLKYITVFIAITLISLTAIMLVMNIAENLNIIAGWVCLSSLFVCIVFLALSYFIAVVKFPFSYEVTFYISYLIIFVGTQTALLINQDQKK